MPNGLQSPESISPLIILKHSVDGKLSWICLLCNISKAEEDVMRLFSLKRRNNPILSITKHFSRHHSKVVDVNNGSISSSVSSVSSAAVAIDSANSVVSVEIVGVDIQHISKSSKPSTGLYAFTIEPKPLAQSNCNVAMSELDQHAAIASAIIVHAEKQFAPGTFAVFDSCIPCIRCNICFNFGLVSAKKHTETFVVDSLNQVIPRLSTHIGTQFHADSVVRQQKADKNTNSDKVRFIRFMQQFLLSLQRSHQQLIWPTLNIVIAMATGCRMLSGEV